MGKSIAIRVDWGGQVGTGHWVRTHTLADELARRGHHVLFVARNQSQSTYEPATAHDVIWLPKQLENFPQPLRSEFIPGLMHPEFLPMGEESDFIEFLEKVKVLKIKFDLIVTDHYGITSKWQGKARTIANAIVAIDDLADRDLDTDLLLDQNFFFNPADRYFQHLPPNTKTLFGPSFALLRPSFALASALPLATKNHGDGTAVVCFGGREFGNINFGVAELLLKSTLLKVHVLGNPIPEFGPRWRELSCQYPGRLGGPEFTDDPATVFRNATVFIGSGGSITWERFAVGLPGAVFAIARNQEQMSQDVATAGYQYYLGDSPSIVPDKLLEAVSALCNHDTRKTMIEKMMSLVDGKGTARVADAIEKLMIT